MSPALYPFSGQLSEISRGFSDGNFGLWFNKFIPVSDGTFKVCDSTGSDTKAISFYRSQFHNMTSRNSLLQNMLNQKHLHQIRYGEVVSQRYEKLVLQVELVTPLIVGLGESHPAEVALVFDHTLGIPYIPASSVKGVVRFAYSLGLLEDEDGNFSDRYVKKEETKEGVKEILDEANSDTLIPQMFGGDSREADADAMIKRRGGIIFLDAYPVEIPQLRTDVMTPHYPDYYSDRGDQRTSPPTDNQDPNPIQFLCVPQGTRFVFRVLVERNLSNAVRDVLVRAIERAVVHEGVGAKTAAGYGRFKVASQSEPNILPKHPDQGSTESPPTGKGGQGSNRELEAFKRKVKELDKGDQPQIDSLFSRWQNDENLRGSVEIARLFAEVVRQKRTNGQYTRQYAIVRELLEKAGDMMGDTD